MLVLSRKIGERIHVGNNITIEVRRIAGNRVTLALEAPRDIRILRGELERVAREFHPTPTEENGSKTSPAAPRSVHVIRGLSADVSERNYVI